MATDTEICNLSLSHLAVGKSIATMDERSQLAATCRLFFEVAYKQLLRDFPWPVSKRYVALSLVEEDPTSEWGFSYRYPANCLDIRRILSGVRNDTAQSKVKYSLGSDDSGILIYTDQEDAEIEFTAYTTNYSMMPPDMVMAFSFLLASLIAPSVTGGDPFRLGERAEARYLRAIGMAQSNALNEEQPDEEPEAELIRARE